MEWEFTSARKRAACRSWNGSTAIGARPKTQDRFYPEPRFATRIEAYDNRLRFRGTRVPCFDPKEATVKTRKWTCDRATNERKAFAKVQCSSVPPFRRLRCTPTTNRSSLKLPPHLLMRFARRVEKGPISGDEELSHQTVVASNLGT